MVKRIAQHLPDVKIIYMVRNPFDRIRSAWFEWLATADSSGAAHERGLDTNLTGIMQFNFAEKNSGNSVRCVKD